MGLNEHLPTQESRLFTTPVYGASTAAVQHFFARLKTLRLNDWAAAGRAASPFADVPSASPARAEAVERLNRIMDDMPHERLRADRRIDDIAAAAVGFTNDADTGAMRRSALTAALALIARPHLGEEDFRALYEPFASLIPCEEIGIAT